MRSKYVGKKSFLEDMRSELNQISTVREGFLLKNGNFVDYYFESVKLAINLIPFSAYQFFNNKNTLINMSICANSEGISLLHIFEYDWWKNKEALLNFIFSKLNVKEKKVFRACNARVREIDKELFLKFYKENSFVNINKNKLERFFMLGDGLAVLATGGCFNNDTRTASFGFSTTSDFKVIGALGKLVKFASDRLEKELTISFETRFISLNTNIFKKSNLQVLRIVEPRKIAFNQVMKPNFFMIMKRIENVDRLEEKFVKTVCFTSYDQNKTSEENLKDNGYKLFFDAGSIVFSTKK